MMIDSSATNLQDPNSMMNLGYARQIPDQADDLSCIDNQSQSRKK